MSDDDKTAEIREALRELEAQRAMAVNQFSMTETPTGATQAHVRELAAKRLEQLRMMDAAAEQEMQRIIAQRQQLDSEQNDMIRIMNACDNAPHYPTPVTPMPHGYSTGMVGGAIGTNPGGADPRG